MTLAAFQARGNTQSIQASSAGSTPVRVCAGNQQGMFIANPTTQPMYWVDGSSSVLAAFPTTNTPGTGLCLPGGSAGAFVTDPAGWLSVATSGGTFNIFATPGFGQ